MDADLGVVSQRVRIRQRGLPDGLSLAQQPASEVVKAVVGAAAVDQIGGAPQVPAVGLDSQLVLDAVPVQDLNN